MQKAPPHSGAPRQLLHSPLGLLQFAGSPQSPTPAQALCGVSPREGPYLCELLSQTQALAESGGPNLLGGGGLTSHLRTHPGRVGAALWGASSLLGAQAFVRMELLFKASDC